LIDWLIDWYAGAEPADAVECAGGEVPAAAHQGQHHQGPAASQNRQHCLL